MASETGTTIEYHLSLDDEERAELETLLEQALGETRVEAHRTHTPAFREQVQRQEDVIRRLLEKLSRLRNP
jgi:hypothetical protein